MCGRGRAKVQRALLKHLGHAPDAVVAVAVVVVAVVVVIVVLVR